jgi:hypothetical protein
MGKVCNRGCKQVVCSAGFDEEEEARIEVQADAESSEDDDGMDDGGSKGQHGHEASAPNGGMADFLSVDLNFIWATHARHKTTQVTLF